MKFDRSFLFHLVGFKRTTNGLGIRSATKASLTMRKSVSSRPFRIRMIHILILTVVCFSMYIIVLWGSIHRFSFPNERDFFSLDNRHIRQIEAQKHVSTAVRLSSTPLTFLRPIDIEKYTIRVNTYRRNEQLLISLNHHSKCEGVAQIQVIWCDSENEPPLEVLHHPSGKVVVEKHIVNSLNERFHILLPTPTLGILSMDDDVLRPCQAIDSGFFRWTRNPERMVGYDPRVHVTSESKWQVCFYD